MRNRRTALSHGGVGSRTPASEDLAGRGDYLAALMVRSGRKTINAHFDMNAAQRTLIMHVTESEERRSWFAFTGSLRNIGLAAGSAAAAGPLAVFGKGSLWWMIAVDAATYLLAAACFAALTTTPPEPEDAPPSALVTRADNARRYLLLVAANIPYVLAQAVLAVLVAVYTTRDLGLPASAASVLFVINTVIASGCSTAITAHVAPKVPRRAVAAGYLIMAVGMGALALPALPYLAFTTWPALVVAIVLFSVAEILLGPALSELSVSLTPEAAGGFTQGLYQLSWAIGRVAAPALFTLLLKATSWPVSGRRLRLAVQVQFHLLHPPDSQRSVLPDSGPPLREPRHDAAHHVRAQDVLLRCAGVGRVSR